MISTSIHDIKSVKITKSRKLNNSRTQVREMMLITEKGERYEITLFSEDKSFLKIKNI